MSEFTCRDGTRLPVSVRVSTRAKHLRLSLSFTGDLEVIVPVRLSKKMKSLEYNPRDPSPGLATGSSHTPESSSASDLIRASTPESIEGFLEHHRSWIERSAKRSKQQRESYKESETAGLPTHLDFPLCDEIWLVEYRQTQAKSVTVKGDGLRRFQGSKRVFALKISGATSDETLCRSALIRFVAQHAKSVIPPFVREVCHEIGASPKSITVNNRKSAWGVCTRGGEIRIDRRVMFLPKDLARQVVLHELAHLKFLNHSRDFYDELYSYEGSTKEAEKAVKKAIQFVPAWFIAGR